MLRQKSEVINSEIISESSVKADRYPTFINDIHEDASDLQRGMISDDCAFTVVVALRVRVGVSRQRFGDHETSNIKR